MVKAQCINLSGAFEALGFVFAGLDLYSDLTRELQTLKLESKTYC